MSGHLEFGSTLHISEDVQNTNGSMKGLKIQNRVWTF